MVAGSPKVGGGDGKKKRCEQDKNPQSATQENQITRAADGKKRP
jgi:hypothetical protein